VTSVADEVQLHEDGPVTHVVLARPHKRNALTLEHWRRLTDLLAGVARSASVRVLVIRSSDERAFCSGADRDEFAVVRATHELADSYADAVEQAMQTLRDVPVPTVAVVRGACIGGGVDIVLSSDVVLADPTAYFRLFPASMGILLPLPISRRLSHAIGARRAAHLLLTGAAMTAVDAQASGLVSEVVDAVELEARVAKVTATVAAQPPGAIAATKRQLLDAAAPNVAASNVAAPNVAAPNVAAPNVAAEERV
jgi:enoyl-CoA hydratase